VPVQRKDSFREGMPNPGVDLVDNQHKGPQAVEFQSNKNMSGGRDLSRPLQPGVRAPYSKGRKGRKGRAR
jgi:hypothetical protein